MTRRRDFRTAAVPRWGAAAPALAVFATGRTKGRDIAGHASTGSDTASDTASGGARTGGLELVDVLLDLALHDAAEVRIAGGLEELNPRDLERALTYPNPQVRWEARRRQVRDGMAFLVAAGGDRPGRPTSFAFPY